MPKLDYKGREITKKASTWDQNAGSHGLHVCCNSASSDRHFAKCGQDDFVKDEEEKLEQRIPMLLNGKAKEKKCQNEHVYFSSSDEVQCPYCGQKPKRLATYVDPRKLQLKKC